VKRGFFTAVCSVARTSEGIPLGTGPSGVAHLLTCYQHGRTRVIAARSSVDSALPGFRVTTIEGEDSEAQSRLRVAATCL
jgi:hypothetical protein